MGEVVPFPLLGRPFQAAAYTPSAEALSDLLHERSKHEAVLIETRFEHMRGESGLSVYCNGRFKGVWICRERTYDWVPPSYTHAICRAASAATAAAHTLLWIDR